MSPDPSQASTPGAYRVLARKYRPSTFAEVIGQPALVRTLTNAITGGRLAHAFLLTGVRGVGKTTTARIIARALNCIGPDGKGGPTPAPCGVCDPCRGIAADRHPDVIEMDAASRTGVDDIRELIDGVRYGPVAARYKVYIVDEVHMLSKQAFNALLKTLEEPPPHVKFVFATTELRRVPVTVLSRCQRFDLRRIDADVLAQHFAEISAKEGIAVEPEAVAAIARAADGSARDGLSLLDQAMALADGPVTLGLVRDMLGLADRSRLLDLFEAAVKGDGPGMLAIVAELHQAGADPVVVVQDLLDLTHVVTKARLIPGWLERAGLPEPERVRGGTLAQSLSVPVLGRLWQLLLKGLTEVQEAPQPQIALEMALIRLIHAASLPTPGELLQRLEGGGGDSGPAPRPQRAAPTPGPRAVLTQAVPQMAAPAPLVAAPPAAAVVQPATTSLGGFPDIVALFGEKGDPVIYGHLVNGVHLVRLEPERLELRLAEGVPSSLPGQVAGQLTAWTGERWVVTVTNAEGQPTLAQQRRAAARAELEQAAEHPLVKAALSAFPGATIEAVRPVAREAPPMTAETVETALDEPPAFDQDMAYDELAQDLEEG